MTEPPEGGAPSGGTTPPADEFKPITSQDDFNRAIADRITRERAKFADYDQLKTKAGELDEIKKANQTELEQATGRATAAETERDTVKAGSADVRRENALLRTGIRLGVKADRLSDSRSFMAEVAGLDPDSATFTADLESKIKAAAQADPTLNAAAAPVVRPNRQQGTPSEGKSSSVEAGRELFRETRGKQTTSS